MGEGHHLTRVQLLGSNYIFDDLAALQQRQEAIRKADAFFATSSSKIDQPLFPGSARYVQEVINYQSIISLQNREVNSLSRLPVCLEAQQVYLIAIKYTVDGSR
jgi:hypothetical protein